MNFKYYRPMALMAVIILLSTSIDWVVTKFVLPYLSKIDLDHFRVPTTLSILGLLFTIYDNYLWKFPMFNLLVKLPNMAGRYEGKIKFHFDGQDMEKDCVIEVAQSASKIKVYSYYSDGNGEDTSSRSLVEDVKEEEDGFFDIYLFYLNSGTKRTTDLDTHEGANKLRFIPAKGKKPSQLVGHYFTSRKTRGEIKATYRSESLKGKF